MFDKNGIEIKTGDIVEITGAYFKNDNGFYFVANSYGDPSWCGTDHSLRKISKQGKISKSVRNICFWPIMITVNNRFKRAEAKEWNEEHAEIKIIDGVDKTEIIEYFKNKEKQSENLAEDYKWRFGEESTVVKDTLKIKEHYAAVVERITG